jgi:2-oxo-4-hydroxy-4-carboxy-5-ureidoimidazoline decarboxylase
MTIDQLNQLDGASLAEHLRRCCGATRWVEGVIAMRPYDSLNDLLDKADKAWGQCEKSDWLEAFTHHPKIGDVASLEKKFADTREWAGNEQSGVQQAAREVIEALARGNEDYESKFGFIFIVCATGKTASEMLALLNDRLPNDPETEVRIAAGEQAKITRIRLEKLLV